MELISDLSKYFYELYTTAPRTTISAEEVDSLYTHTGHVYQGQMEVVAMPVANENPTQAELLEFLKKFEEIRAYRAIYSFAGVTLGLVKNTEGKFGLISMPVLILRAQTTPRVIYNGANKLPLPTYATKGSIGFDIAADESVILEPGARKVVRTGLYLDANDWDRNSPCYLRIAPKSGLAVKKGIDVLAGVVDGDYPEEIGIVLVNHDSTQHVFEIGDKIAQGIWEVAVQGGNLPTAPLARIGGFGSTT
jgi:dUTP pyrophosphatase